MKSKITKTSIVGILVLVLLIATIGMAIYYTKPKMANPVLNNQLGGLDADIKTGLVDINEEQIIELQKAVDRGHQPWRLDPLMVAKAEGQKYGFSATDTFALEEIRTSDSVARVKVLHNKKIYFVTLLRPVLSSGKADIWAIQKIEE